MAKIPLAIESLEFQSNQAFAALRRAVQGRKARDIYWAKKLYRAWIVDLCDEVKYYKEGGDIGGVGFLKYNRTPRRAALYDRYILQYLTGSSCSEALARIESCRDVSELIKGYRREVGDVSVKVKNLFEALQQQDTRLPYMPFYILISELRRGCHVEPLWKAVQCVRKHYQKPEK